MKHKVRMLKTAIGVHDGEVIPATFFEGSEHSIGDSLLGAFVDMGVVEMAEDPAAPEAKSEGDAPANKMKKAAPENKSRK